MGFVEDGSSALPPVKANANAPTGAPSDWAAGDANRLRQALLDLRSDLTGWVDVRQYGATGDGLTDDYAAFAAAYSANGMVVPPGAYLLSASLLLSQPVTMQTGAYFVIPNGVTLTLNGVFTAPLTKVFSCSGTGSVVFGPDAIVEAFPQWFGAIADGNVTDNSPAIRLAVNSMPWGGKLKIPAGQYRMTTEVALHAGITVEGVTSIDRWSGSPPYTAGMPSYLWQETSNNAIFTIGGGAESIYIRDLSLAPAVSPSSTPPGAGKHGIRMLGEGPQFVWQISIERCYFYNLDYAISCVDPNAGAAAPDYDWSVAPVSIRNCVFRYPNVGIYLDTNNADGWLLDSCSFNVPTNGIGFYGYRFGYFELLNCFAGGATATGNSFVKIVGHGAESIENFKLDNCQAETLAHFIWFDAAGTATLQRTATIQNCIWQMGADIYVGRPWELLMIGNYVGEYVYVESTGVIVHSICDRIVSGKHISFIGVGISATSYIKTYIPGQTVDSTLVGADGYIMNGRSTIYANAAPGGTWKTGDRTINSSPTVGQPKAWVYTGAAWQSEGNL